MARLARQHWHHVGVVLSVSYVLVATYGHLVLIVVR